MSPIAESPDFYLPGSQSGGSRIDDDAVVISGISTLMPGSRNIMEYAEKLYNKENLVKQNNTRWNFKYPELSRHHGTIPQLGCFDAQFFMVYHKMAQSLDAMTRKLLEQSYQAIFDAGICPTELSGKPIGVYVATGTCESEYACAFTDVYLGIMGCNRAMAANRISYYLNLKGPSMYLDGQATGTAVALQKAYSSIMTGQCEAAIVGGARLLLHPQTSLVYHKLAPASPDGKVKCYDANADGIALSETVSVIFLQKHKDAKRVYASVRYVKTDYSGRLDENLDQQFGPYRDPEGLTKFLREFYQEANVSPSQVGYIEGFGAADLKADKAELDAIDEVFCKGRQSSLPVGSVVSNVGFTEAASCIASLTKVLLAYNKDKLAANIHYDTPRLEIKGVAEGRLHIVTEHEDFRHDYAAINSFSITGINAHVLLQRNYKQKNMEKYNSVLPRLVMMSGRQESSVQKIINVIKSRPLDFEEIALLHNIFRTRIPKHLARGYAIFPTTDDKNTVTLKEHVDYFDDAKRPLWFVYSGMGSQWAGMGVHLMKIPVFADAIHRCHNALKPKGIDLINVITNPDEAIFDNILYSFVGIAAIQIGLTDVLKSVGIVPDNIIGHSVGELGCAYADGCLTAEEMILSAYSRGLVSIQTPFIKGSMAAVGMGNTQIVKLLPPEIYVACHNGPESCTISGPAEAMEEFVTQLTRKGIFAKEVPCSNIAYHSRYIADAGPGLLKYLKEVIKNPMIRTKRWLSTSVPEERWDEHLALYSGAEYHTNNLLSPVLFEEILKHVPYNAVLVEIAPHGLLQAILKRSLPTECKNISLTRRGHDDNAVFLLEAIGKLYMEGLDIDVSAFYPKIEFPVSNQTRPLSHLVEWMYSEQYKVCQYVQVQDKKKNSVYRPVLSIFDEEYQYLRGNVIDGKKEFPFSGALVLVWDLLAMSLNQPRGKISVQFKDITFHAQPPLYEDQSLHLTVTVQRGSGRFEVSDEERIVVEGFVKAGTQFTDLPKMTAENDDNAVELTNEDVYKILYEKGYHYKKGFRSIQQSNIYFTKAQILWEDNWTLFIDAAFQLNNLRHNRGGITQPLYINRLTIDTVSHFEGKANSERNNKCIEAIYSETLDVTKCGGLYIEHLRFSDRPSNAIPKECYALKEYKFIDFQEEKENADIISSLYVYLQIIVENRRVDKKALNILYVYESYDANILKDLLPLLDSAPEIKYNIVAMNKCELQSKENVFDVQPDIVLLKDVLTDKQITEAFYKILLPNTFIIHVGEIKTQYPLAMYRPICGTGKGHHRVELAKWRSLNTKNRAVIAVNSDKDLDHLRSIKDDLVGDSKILILAPYPPPFGLKEMVQEWRTESHSLKDNIHVIMFNKNEINMQHLDIPNLDLVFNVVDDEGRWGGEYYVPLRNIENQVKNNLSLNITEFGNMSTIKWVESKPTDTADGAVIKVHYAALNVFDAKRARADISIKDSCDRGFGMDFSGITENGDRVMGLIKNGAASETVTALPDLLWPVPTQWSLEDAATVPLPYCLAFYCLVFKARIIKGMNVLIHGGTGAVGQAAISICLATGCNVFTTVSSSHKKRFLQRLFPKLPADHIGNSRDESFEEMVMKSTNGDGCHIILCCVQGALKQASLRCCATSGITIDTVLIHTQENFNYGLFNMTRSRSYTIIDFVALFKHKNREIMKLLQVLVSEGIAKGYVRPLSRVVYSPQEAPRALQLLAESKHRGRVVLNLRLLAPSSPKPSISCSPNACQVVFLSEYDDFGIQWIDRLVENSVEKIYVHCSKPSSYLEYKARSWQNIGTNVQLSYEKLTNKEKVLTFLKNCQHWASIEGLFVVRTGITDPKHVTEANHLVQILDTVSREMGLCLKYFTLIHEGDVEKEVCLARAQANLPALSFEIRRSDKFDEHVVHTFRHPTSLDCLELALHSKQPIVFAYNKNLSEKDEILEEISQITGLNIDNNVHDNKLKEQTFDKSRMQQLCDILKHKYKVALSKEAAANVPVSIIRKLTEEGTKDDKTGFNAYLKYIDSDELLANCNLIPKRTLVDANEVYYDEFDNEQTFLCIVPGIEGLHHRYSRICERLKLPALVLQPGYDVIDTCVRDLAQRLTNVMNSKLVLREQFYLLGYEFGIIVALEMASILEDQGLVGTIFCVGATPEDISVILKTIYSSDSEELENKLIERVYYLVSGHEMAISQKKQFVGMKWNTKVELFIDMVKRHTVQTMDYIRRVLNAIYNRIQLGREYEYMAKKLKSKVIVMQSKLPSKIGDEEKKDAITHDLTADLTNAVDDMQCGSIINKYLDPKILEEFSTKNLCENTCERDQLVFNVIDD